MEDKIPYETFDREEKSVEDWEMSLVREAMVNTLEYLSGQAVAKDVYEKVAFSDTYAPRALDDNIAVDHILRQAGGLVEKEIEGGVYIGLSADFRDELGYKGKVTKEAIEELASDLAGEFRDYLCGRETIHEAKKRWEKDGLYRRINAKLRQFTVEEKKE